MTPRVAKSSKAVFGHTREAVAERHARIIELAAKGLKNPQIAKRLGLSNNTVRAVVARARSEGKLT